MESNLLIILVAILIIFIIVLIALLAYFGHRFLKLRELEAQNKNQPPKVTAETQEVLPKEKSVIHKKISPELMASLRAKKKEAEASLYCVDHPDEFANGKCAISSEPYCEHCLTKQGDVRISRKYLDLYLDNEWTEVRMIANDESNKDVKNRIMKMKKEMWETENLPLIVQEHYKINVQDDEIEEFTVILSRVDDQDYVKKELAYIKE
jgi:hypothetical protein